MGEDLTKFLDAFAMEVIPLREAGTPVSFANLLLAIGNARYKATQPDAVPELPEYVNEHFGGGWYVKLPSGLAMSIPATASPDDLDRIAEAARILAARERARRAGR